MANKTGTQQTTQPAAGPQQAATVAPSDILNTSAATYNPIGIPAEQIPGRPLTQQQAQAGLQSGAIDPSKDVVYVRTRANPAGEPISRSLATRFSANQLYGNVVSATVKSQKLIDAKGNLRDQYTSNDAASELMKLPVDKRLALLKDLYSRGMYPSKQGPSPTGLDNGSINAMEQFLWTSNTTGYTWDVAKPIIMNQYPNVYGAPSIGGGGQTYTVSSPADIERVANSVAEQIIGKRLGKKEIQKIVETVQGRERTAGLKQGGEVVNAPSAQTIAQQQVEKMHSSDAQVMRMGQATQFLDQLMRSI